MDGWMLTSQLCITLPQAACLVWKQTLLELFHEPRPTFHEPRTIERISLDDTCAMRHRPQATGVVG